MAKLFKAFGIGGKKVSDQPCQSEFMSGKTSGSVQELRSTSPSKTRASTIVVSSNSWLGAGVGPDVGADVRRHSDASTIRNIRSRIPSHLKTELSLRGNKTKVAEPAFHCTNPCDGRNGTRSPCAGSECNPMTKEQSIVTSPQIASEYSDPFDLREQLKSDKETKQDTKTWLSEDDYCVPYDVQGRDATEIKLKDPKEEVRKLPLTKCDPACSTSVPTTEIAIADEAPVRLLSTGSSAPGESIVNFEQLQSDDIIVVYERQSSEMKRNSSKDLRCSVDKAHASPASGHSPGPPNVEGAKVLFNPSAGMYDAPWDLNATQKILAESFQAVQPPLQRSTSCGWSQSANTNNFGAAGETGYEAQGADGNAMQIYDEPWDKRAESIQQTFIMADLARERDHQCTFSETGQKHGTHRADQQRLKCRSIGDPSRIRTGVRTGFTSCYPSHSLSYSPNWDHSQTCRHHAECTHSTAYQTCVEHFDESLPLEKQSWYHGTISRVQAELLLRNHREGSYLVRTSESNRLDYSLSLKSNSGDFMHMKIVQQNSHFILGQFSQPFTSIPQMILYYTINKLPIRGTEHMTLSFPVCNELL